MYKCLVQPGPRWYPIPTWTLRKNSSCERWRDGPLPRPHSFLSLSLKTKMKARYKRRRVDFLWTRAGWNWITIRCSFLLHWTLPELGSLRRALSLLFGARVISYCCPLPTQCSSVQTPRTCRHLPLLSIALPIHVKTRPLKFKSILSHCIPVSTLRVYIIQSINLKVQMPWLDHPCVTQVVLILVPPLWTKGW